MNHIKNILVSPRSEWPVIAEEPTDVASLYTGYIMPLSAIPAVCGLIGTAIIGIAGFRVPFGGALWHMVVQYILGLVGVYVLALIVSKLAPTFGGREDQLQALKLVAYGATASWVGGVFMIIPLLGILSLIMSLYSLYILYCGTSVVMKVPQERALGYTVAVIVLAILAAIVIAVIGGLLVGHL